MVSPAGLEPARTSPGGGFKDRCVYQFHHGDLPKLNTTGKPRASPFDEETSVKQLHAYSMGYRFAPNPHPPLHSALHRRRILQNSALPLPLVACGDRAGRHHARMFRFALVRPFDLTRPTGRHVDRVLDRANDNQA